MSQENIIRQLGEPTGNCYFATGITVPSDGATGYAPGCIFVDTDGTTTSKLYCNIGTAASANFNLITVAGDA